MDIGRHVVYIGDNQDVKGITGIIVDSKKNHGKKRQYLVEFEKLKDNSRKARYWCNEDNLLEFII